MLNLLLEVEILREIGAPDIISSSIRSRVRLAIVIELFLLSRCILFTTLSFSALTWMVMVFPAFVVMMVMIVAADHT